MPGRLSRYIAKRFTAMLAVILAVVALIVFLADYVEVLRRFSDDAGFTPLLGLRLSAMRVPILLDAVLPFAFLFATVLGLLSLSRRLELVVARASGVSVWGFLKPVFAISLILGGLAITLFNPLAVDLKLEAENIEATLSGPKADTGGHWFRQDGSAGPSILYAASASNDGRELFGVTAFVFDPAGEFSEKVSAPRAVYGDRSWVMENAAVVSARAPAHETERYELPTDLSAAELRRHFVEPQAISLWSLPGFIDTATRTGVDPDRFRVAFHTLLSRPLYLLAMVAVAATVSLRLTRFGGTWRLFLTGAGIGFLLYALTEIVGDIGGNGIIDPVLAAWLPPIVALTFGATALLYQEDG
jgi:lipopolysaccharide export system permease protein